MLDPAIYSKLARRYGIEYANLLAQLQDDGPLGEEIPRQVVNEFASNIAIKTGIEHVVLDSISNPGPVKDELTTTIGGIVAVGATTTHAPPATLGFAPLLPVDLDTTLTQTQNGVVGNAGFTAHELFDAFSTARTNPATKVYASPTGNDSNAGTFAAPYRSIKKCIQVANAAGQPAEAYIMAGEYPEGQGFEGVSPTVDMSIIAMGGRVLAGRILTGATWAVHATHTNTYYINPTPATGVSRVLDTTQTDQFGNFVELMKVASVEICNVTPNSYFEGGAGVTAMHIRRRDGAQPTSANTRVLQTGDNFVLSSQVNVYLGTRDGSFWEIQGAPNTRSGSDAGAVVAHLTAPTTALRAFVCENVQANYAGEETANVNAFTAHNWNGIAAFFNCRGDAAAKDGFNGHNLLAVAPYFLTVNCGSDNVGRINQSCNGLTMHENMVAVDIGGVYRRGRGGTVHNINDSKQWLVGTRIEDDLGDRASSGTIDPSGLRVNNNALVWADRVQVTMPAGRWAYAAVTSTSRIRRRNCAPVPQGDYGPAVAFESY